MAGKVWYQQIQLLKFKACGIFSFNPNAVLHEGEVDTL